MKKKELLYLGERASPVLEEIVHTFRDADGETASYRGLKGYQFGESYLQTDGTMPRLAKPIEEEKRKLFPTSEDELKFEASKLAIVALRRRRAKAYDLKKPHPRIAQAIELLAPFARSLDAFDRRRFMQYLENQITKPTGRRKR